MNEVCGASGDIRMVMEEFNAGIQDAGLIPLPMQGEWYTWNNCNTNSQSLWKRLDRILINDRWLARFPSSCYHSLLPRTSDHWPLILHGDRQSQTGALKPVFREQRRKKGDLTLNVQLAKGFLDEAQQLTVGKRTRPRDLMDIRQDSLKQPGQWWDRKLLRRYWNSLVQGAFIPGRSIGDNILLAQELLTGYYQVRLPPRCTRKVDIRKAYDTVEWDFLLAVLQLFGFPQTFTKWIEECVTTAAFSIGSNGNPHGFFAGARGLRQGDPLSFFFLGKGARGLRQGFADDPLLFCRVDLNSLRTLKRGLDRFAEWSRLWLNVQKSHVIISRSAQGWKDQILTIMGFQEGQLPMRYLGLPLLSSRLSISDCQPLLLKIDARINGWEGISLSYAGRIQIIKSVLSAMSIYWTSAFILPKAIIKQIEKRLRTFLWKGTSTSGYAKVAWKDVCKPIKKGGQGIKDIGILNRSLIAKKLCDVIRCDRTSIWVEWLKQTRLHNTSIWTINETGGSWGWRKMLRLRSSILPMTEFLIGEGRSFYLWKDPWHHLGPLIARFPRGTSLLGLDESTKTTKDALQLYDIISDLLGPIVSGQETWNGHRGSGGGSILLMLLIEHYLVHAYTIYGERGI
ncbi:UNVERIFIED_CONTAM: hypothetical protein Sindi_1303000 [Sesamum indicum]